MSKPTIRIIHHMARTGGTLICKCLACMEQVIMLSEIHPLGTSMFNPVTQAQEWFQLFSEQEVQNHFSEPTPFASVIGLINNKVEQRGKKLVLRDWTHLDYTAVPFLQQPSYRLLLNEALVQNFNVLRITTTRHPIDQCLSLNRLLLVHNKISLEQYLIGYLRFAEAAKEIGFIRYEDFTKQPDNILSQMTDTLQLKYDSAYKNNWMHYRKITGDAENQWSEIKSRTKPQLEQNLLDSFAANNDYLSALGILGYEHYG